MNSLIKTINKPKEALLDGNRTIAWSLVAVAILASSFLAPTISYFFSIVRHSTFNVGQAFIVSVYGVAAYLAFCTAMWATCKLFGSKATLATYISTWGLTFVPTALCAIILPFTETFFYVFWNNSIWGILMSILFVMFLIWKFILYVLYLKEICSLSKWSLLGAMIVVGVEIVVLASLQCRYLGIMVPII